MLKSIGYKSALISITVSIFGLLGYIPGLDLLGRVRSEYIPMAPSTGVSFLILGIILITLYMKQLSKVDLVLILISSFLVSIFGILEVVGYFVDMDLNYEDSIVPFQGYLNGVPIARMSPATGLVFFTSGVSIIFFTIQQFSLKQSNCNELIVNIFGYLSLIISFTFCLSYLYGTPFLYESNNTIPMALTTAISFLFLSVSLIFIHLDNYVVRLFTDTSTRNYLFKFIFPIAALSVIVSALATVFTIQSTILNPALISATITILIVLSIGILSNYLSLHMGISIDKAEKELKISNDELESKTKELETIIQVAPNPIILHEEGGKIRMLNQAWIDSSGFSLEETPTIGAWVERMYDDIEKINSVKKHIHSLYEITEKVDEGEFTFFNKNRDLVTWQFSSAPLGVIDGKCTVISSAMDITELKHKDEMLINQSRSAAMGEMIGMIAHQWRQPITAISMNANNLLVDIELDSYNSTETEKYAKNITQLTGHLSQTIDDFRNFFKPDKVVSEVNIREIMDGTLSIVNDSLKNNNIELKITFETEKKVNAYPRELMQVFVNIINNAKDVLTLKKPDDALISVRVYEDKKYVNIEICDNGGGIDENILSKIFDPYFSTKDEKTGTGLGLYMSKMIIEEHLNGLIEVYNDDNGACFTLRL